MAYLYGLQSPFSPETTTFTIIVPGTTKDDGKLTGKRKLFSFKTIAPKRLVDIKKGKEGIKEFFKTNIVYKKPNSKEHQAHHIHVTHGNRDDHDLQKVIDRILAGRKKALEKENFEKWFDYQLYAVGAFYRACWSNKPERAIKYLESHTDQIKGFKHYCWDKGAQYSWIVNKFLKSAPNAVDSAIKIIESLYKVNHNMNLKQDLNKQEKLNFYFTVLKVLKNDLQQVSPYQRNANKIKKNISETIDKIKELVHELLGNLSNEEFSDVVKIITTEKDKFPAKNKYNSTWDLDSEFLSTFFEEIFDLALKSTNPELVNFLLNLTKKVHPNIDVFKDVINNITIKPFSNANDSNIDFHKDISLKKSLNNIQKLSFYLTIAKRLENIRLNTCKKLKQSKYYNEELEKTIAANYKTVVNLTKFSNELLDQLPNEDLLEFVKLITTEKNKFPAKNKYDFTWDKDSEFGSNLLKKIIDVALKKGNVELANLLFNSNYHDEFANKIQDIPEETVKKLITEAIKNKKNVEVALRILSKIKAEIKDNIISIINNSSSKDEVKKLLIQAIKDQEYDIFDKVVNNYKTENFNGRDIKTLYLRALEAKSPKVIKALYNKCKISKAIKSAGVIIEKALKLNIEDKDLLDLIKELKVASINDTPLQRILYKLLNGSDKYKETIMTIIEECKHPEKIIKSLNDNKLGSLICLEINNNQYNKALEIIKISESTNKDFDMVQSLLNVCKNKAINFKIKSYNDLLVKYNELLGNNDCNSDPINDHNLLTEYQSIYDVEIH
ncbi:MAG: hypothetical protein HRU35_05435 [Rickettsiaceae bacterium]|nr:hypothetical protein [Rickettsiaceae bacterium]